MRLSPRHILSLLGLALAALLCSRMAIAQPTASVGAGKTDAEATASREHVPESAGVFDSLAALFSGQVRELDRERAELRTRLAETPALVGGQSGSQLGYHSQMTGETNAARWVQIDLGASLSFDTIAIVPAQAAQSSESGVPYGFPRRFRVEVSDDEKFTTGRTVFDRTNSDFADPGVYPVLLPTPGVAGRYVRLTATRLAQGRRLAFLALGELMVLDGPRNLAVGKPVTALSSVENAPAWSAANLVDGRSPLGPPFGASVVSLNGYHSGIELTADVTKWVQVDLGEQRDLQEIRLVPARPHDFPDRLGFGFPRRFRVELADEPTFLQPVVVADHTQEDFANPGPHPVVVSLHGESARYVRVTATRLWERTQDFVFALGELQAFADGENVALGCDVMALDWTENGSWSRAALVDGFASQRELLDWPTWLRHLDERHGWERQLAELDAQRGAATREVLARLGRWLGFGVLALAATLGGSAWRARRRRRREVALLRERIGRDLHDEIGSNLGSIALLSQMAAQRETSQSRADLEQINQIARQTADSMRDIVWLLSRESDTPAEWTLRLRATAAALLAGIEHEVDVAPDAWPAGASPELKREALLIYKEALYNIARHAHARRVAIRVFRDSGGFHLWIHDNGCGFDAARKTSGAGLASMRSRATALGGKLEIRSTASDGTTLELTAPLT